LNYLTAQTVVLIVAFSPVTLALLEISLLWCVIARLDRGGDRPASAEASRRGHRFAVIALAVLGGLLVLNALIELLA
jgi:hypothetical protein